MPEAQEDDQNHEFGPDCDEILAEIQETRVALFETVCGLTLWRSDAPVILDHRTSCRSSPTNQQTKEACRSAEGLGAEAGGGRSGCVFWPHPVRSHPQIVRLNSQRISCQKKQKVRFLFCVR
jgi:hypothetical protein